MNKHNNDYYVVDNDILKFEERVKEDNDILNKINNNKKECNYDDEDYKDIDYEIDGNNF